MGELFSAKSIVLHRRHLNESSEVVLLLSSDKGRIDAVCSGINKPHSSLRGKVEPFTELEGFFVKGRGALARLTQAKTIKVRPAFYADYECLCWGSYLLELFASVAPGVQEGGYVAEPVECERFYTILAEALDNLSSCPRKGVAVSVWVLWHLLKLMGSAPDLDRCTLCGAKHDLICFSSAAGGALCGHCAVGRLEAAEIRTEVFSLWKQFISTSLAEALQQRYLPAVYAEAEYLLWNHFYQNWHITLKSRRLLQIGERSLESFRH